MSSRSSNKKTKSRQGKRPNSARNLFTAPQGMSISRNPKGVPFPDVMRCVMTYEQRQAVTCTAGVYNLQQFSANSLYDPYVTSTGGSPEFYAELSNLYNAYRVVRCHVDVLFMTTGTTAPTQTFRAAISMEPTATSPSTFEAVEAAPYSRRRICAGVTNPVPRLTMSMPIHKIFGIEESAILDDSRFTGNYNSNPSNNAIINVAVQPLDNATTSVIIMEVRLKYTAEWYARQTDTTQGLLKDLNNESKTSFILSCTGSVVQPLPKSFGLG